MYILAIDQGTTGTTASLIDKEGHLVTQQDQDFHQIYPQPGWVEHNPLDIWDSVRTTVRKLLEKTKVEAKDIAGIGITNQRETVVIWDRQSGQPIHNAIVWQDRRTAAFCEKIKGKEKSIQSKTGLLVDPYFSATKIKWILENVSGAHKKAEVGQLAAGTIDTFLMWKLTQGKTHKTDVSNASRTLLLNIETLAWDKDLLKLFKIPQALLAEVSDSSGVFGETSGLDFLPDGIKIAGVAGDQQSALFGQACFDPGEAKCTYGTGSFLLLNTGKKIISSKHKMLTTVAWRLPQQKTVYALEGSAFICGAAVQWLRDGLGIIKSSSEVEELARSVKSSEGVIFVPALTGMGAPHWLANARGQITGITRGTTKAHIARATLEAMALQNTELLVAMQKDMGQKLKALKVDGGASANNLLMQMQADYMGVSVIRPKQIETTSMGAAYLAGLGVGLWSSTDMIQKIWLKDQEFKADIANKVKNDTLRSWQKAIAKLG